MLQITVQPYGHDLGWLEQYRGKSDLTIIRFGFVGQLIDSKGAHLLLASGTVCSQGRLGNGFTVQIYGNLDKDPAYGAQLRALAAGVSSVTFRGTYTHEESAAVFADMDVLVVPVALVRFPIGDPRGVCHRERR